MGLLALVVVSIPLASAQVEERVDIAIGQMPALIKPDVESPAFPIEVTATCPAVLKRVSPAAPQSPLPVVLGFDATMGVSISGALTVELDPAPCLAGEQVTSGHYELQVTIPRTAPGFQPIPGTAHATLFSASPLGQELASAATRFTVTADYYSINQVKLASKLQVCIGPCEATFDLAVTNFGNARTQYTFALASQPADEGWSAAAPDALVLDPAATATVPFTVHGPSGDREGAFQIVIQPTAVDDPTKQGNALTANMLMRVHPRDDGRDVPSPGSAVTLLLMGLALLARRRA